MESVVDRLGDSAGSPAHPGHLDHLESEHHASALPWLQSFVQQPREDSRVTSKTGVVVGTLWKCGNSVRGHYHRNGRLKDLGCTGRIAEVYQRLPSRKDAIPAL